MKEKIPTITMCLYQSNIVMLIQKDATQIHGLMQKIRNFITLVTALLMQWSYTAFALSHRIIAKAPESRLFAPTHPCGSLIFRMQTQELCFLSHQWQMCQVQVWLQTGWKKELRPERWIRTKHSSIYLWLSNSIYRWLCIRLWHLQCLRNGDSIHVSLYSAIDMANMFSMLLQWFWQVRIFSK